MKILVPKDINDITLEQYQKFAIINTDDQDEEFFIHKTISIFCDVDMQTVSKFPIKDAKEIAEEIQNVLSQNVPFTSRFEMNGVEYGFIPDLEKMSLGEFVDLENSLKDSKDFHKAAAVMYRPVKKRFKELYTIDPYNPSRSIHEAFKQAPIGVISAAIVFFYSIANELLAVSQHYTAKQMNEVKTTLERLNSEPNTVGLAQYTLYLEAMQHLLKK